MKKIFGSLMLMCVLAASMAAFAQDQMTQNDMKNDDAQHDTMKNDKMKKDKKSKKASKNDQMKHNDMKQDNMKHDDMNKDDMKKDEIKNQLSGQFKGAGLRARAIFCFPTFSTIPQDDILFARMLNPGIPVVFVRIYVRVCL